MNKLSVSQLYRKCNLDLKQNFNTTNDIEPLNCELLNQQKAKNILDFGLSIDKYGYNIFLSGEQSSRRKIYLNKILSQKASVKDIPPDLCYVHNFKEERKPILIELPAGKGYEFKKDIKELINKIKNEVEIFFNDSNYKKEKELIEQEFDSKSEASIDKFKQLAKKHFSHTIDFTPEGQIYITPLSFNGIPLNSDDFDNLPLKAKTFYKAAKKEVGLLIVEMLHEQELIQNNRDKALDNLDKNNASSKIHDLMQPIISKYISFTTKIETYFADLKIDLLENLSLFKTVDNSNLSIDLFGNNSSSSDDLEYLMNKYCVNLIVDNKDLTSAPIIFASNCVDSSCLLGTTAIFIDSKGMMTTDFTQIKSGELLKANGGFLVIDSDYLSPEVWEDLKNVLKNKKLEISSKYYKSDIVLSDALTPEPININLKVIMLGSYETHNTLSTYDLDFNELFEIHSSFDIEMDRTPDSEIEYLQFVSKYCSENEIRPLSKEAVEKIIEYSSRVAENQNKIALSYRHLYNILTEANVWASKQGEDIITLDIINTTLNYKNYMLDNYTEYRSESFKNNTILIDIFGHKVGQINGLCVYNVGSFSIGEPTKITATTYKGKSKIISIERDIDMAGPVHNKAINILTGFLNEQLNCSIAPALTSTLTFEQNYSGIEGDSATIAELCAILSSMSGLPIDQSFAVTGSMNQKGYIQAVGGVNEKIEGFFDVCKALKSSKKNSVIIPYSNEKNLMLKQEILDSVEEGSFEIYSVKEISEAIKLLFGVSLDKILETIKNKHNLE